MATDWNKSVPTNTTKVKDELSDLIRKNWEALSTVIGESVLLAGTSLGSLYDGFVDRGDPSVVDKLVGDFSTDGNPHDLDLSAIVPAGAKLVAMKLEIKDDATDSYIIFKEKGNSNNVNTSKIKTQAINVENCQDMFVACDVNRVVTYIASNTTFTMINLVVKGWWL